MIINMLYSLIDFIVEFVKLFPLMYFVMNFELKPLKKVLLYSVSAILLTVLPCLLPISLEMPISAYICLIFTMIILKGKRKIIYTLVTYIGICLFDMLAGSVLLLFLDYDFYSLNQNSQMSVIVNSISIVAVLFIVALSKSLQNRRKYSDSKIGIFYIFLILFGETAILCFITVFQYSDSSNKILAVTLSISGIVFMLICTLMILNYISKENYRSISEINQKLLKNQENYYTMLLQKDRETIKFRHDVRNHINCMYLLLNNGKYDELKEYFDKIGATLSELKPSVQTGNDMISAILNDTVTKYPNVKCEIEGKVANDIRLSHIDMCTIFSNLFENAFYAADNSEEKIVNISFRFAGSNLFCEIRNTVSHKVEITDNKPVSEKTDEMFHGYGISNVKAISEKYGGVFTIERRGSSCATTLVLPIQ